MILTQMLDFLLSVSSRARLGHIDRTKKLMVQWCPSNLRSRARMLPCHAQRRENVAHVLNHIICFQDVPHARVSDDGWLRLNHFI